MKKTILSMLFAVMTVGLSAVFTSCSDDETGFVRNPTFDVNELYGMWYIEGTSGSSNGTFVWLSQLDGTYISFRNDGSFRTKGYFGNNTGNYTINRNIIDITAPDGANGYIRIEVIEISSKDAIFKLDVNGESSRYFKCKKNTEEYEFLHLGRGANPRPNFSISFT